MQVLEKTIKPLLLYIIFSVNIILGQTDTINKVGSLNDPNVPEKSRLTEITIYSEPADRSKPTLIKAKYYDRDTILELVYDPTYKGTAIELAEEINTGTLEKYFVIENDGKLYERIKVVQFEESFFDKYWLFIGIGLAIAIFAYYKLNIQKKSIDTETEENSTPQDSDL